MESIGEPILFNRDGWVQRAEHPESIIPHSPAYCLKCNYKQKGGENYSNILREMSANEPLLEAHYNPILPLMQ